MHEDYITAEDFYLLETRSVKEILKDRKDEQGQRRARVKMYAQDIAENRKIKYIPASQPLTP